MTDIKGQPKDQEQLQIFFSFSFFFFLQICNFFATFHELGKMKVIFVVLYLSE